MLCIKPMRDGKHTLSSYKCKKCAQRGGADDTNAFAIKALWGGAESKHVDEYANEAWDSWGWARLVGVDLGICNVCICECVRGGEVRAQGRGIEAEFGLEMRGRESNSSAYCHVERSASKREVTRRQRSFCCREHLYTTQELVGAPQLTKGFRRHE